MKPKQWSKQYGAIFKDRSVVKACQYCPAYNQETIEIIVDLLGTGEKKHVLDAGCGTAPYLEP